MTLTSVKLCTLHQNVENISTHTVCVAKKCHLKFGCMVHGEVSPAVFSEAFLGDFFPLRVGEFTKSIEVLTVPVMLTYVYGCVGA